MRLKDGQTIEGVNVDWFVDVSYLSNCTVKNCRVVWSLCAKHSSNLQTYNVEVGSRVLNVEGRIYIDEELFNLILCN